MDEHIKKFNITEVIQDGKRFIQLYHGTNTKNLRGINKTGFKVGSYFTHCERTARLYGSMSGGKLVIMSAFVCVDSLYFDGYYFSSNKILEQANDGLYQ